MNDLIINYLVGSFPCYYFRYYSECGIVSCLGSPLVAQSEVDRRLLLSPDTDKKITLFTSQSGEERRDHIQ